MIKLTLVEAQITTLMTRKGTQFNVAKSLSKDYFKQGPGIILFFPTFAEFGAGKALRDTPVIPYSIMSDTHLESLVIDGEPLGVLSKGSGYVDVNPALTELSGIVCFYEVNRH